MLLDELAEVAVEHAEGVHWIFSVGGRMVVWKWAVSSAWPKPDPGTTQMPVCSSRAMA